VNCEQLASLAILAGLTTLMNCPVNEDVWNGSSGSGEGDGSRFVDNAADRRVGGCNDWAWRVSWSFVRWG